MLSSFPPIGPKKQAFKAVLRGCGRMLKCHLNQCPHLHPIGDPGDSACAKGGAGCN